MELAETLHAPQDKIDFRTGDKPNRHPCARKIILSLSMGKPIIISQLIDYLKQAKKRYPTGQAAAFPG